MENSEDKNIEINKYDRFIENFKKILLVGIGTSLFVVGLVSLLFPFLPGFFIIFIGLTFCAKGSTQIAKTPLVIKVLRYLGGYIKKIEKVFVAKLKKSKK